jgi:GGDEF domain-containing protein
MAFRCFSVHFARANAWLHASTSLLAGLCLSVTLGLLSPLAQARTVLEFDAQKQPVSLADWGDYWIAPTTTMGVNQVADDDSLPWRPTMARGIYPLTHGQTLWIRFTVPPAPDAERWLLEIPFPGLNRASLYTLDSADQWLEQRTGDLTAVNRWPIPHRYPLMGVAFNAEEPTYYLLRLEHDSGFSAPLRFVSASYVLRNEQRVSLFLGVYFGLALLGCAVGLIGMLWLRDSAYLYYALCSALIGLVQATISGVGNLHLWPDSPGWADRSLALLGIWMLMSLLVLNASVVSLAQRSRSLNILVWFIVLVGALLSVPLALANSEWRLPLVLPYLLLIPALVLLINLWAWRHGERFGGWLLLCTLPLSLGLALASARFLQWLPLSFATEQLVLTSMALQMPAMLLVLMLRSQQRRENRRRVLGLDRVDPTTGLITEQLFAERMTRMIARSQRFSHQSAVLMIDLVNMDQVRIDYGRNTAIALRLRVAGRLLATVREIDSAARLSEHRFGILVEGPISAQDAATLGPRMVARCLMPYPDLPSSCFATVRVAYALVPRQGPSAAIVLARLNQKLAEMATETKRASFGLSDYHSLSGPMDLSTQR